MRTQNDLKPSPVMFVVEQAMVKGYGCSSFQASDRNRRTSSDHEHVSDPLLTLGGFPLQTSESNPRPIVVSGAPPRRFSLGMTCPDLRHIRPRTVPASELAPAYGCKHPEKLMEHVIGNRHKSLAWRVTTVALNEKPLLRLG